MINTLMIILIIVQLVLIGNVLLLIQKQKKLFDLHLKISEKIANPAFIINPEKLEQVEAVLNKKPEQPTGIIYREDEDLAEAEEKNQRGRRYHIGN